MIHHPQIKQVGSNVEVGIADLSYYFPPTPALEDLSACVREYFQALSIRRFAFLPNFNFEPPTAPSGWVAELAAHDNFVGGMVQGSIYRVITMVEVSPPITKDWKDEAQLKEKYQRVRKTIPLNSVCPPSLEDDPTMGWSPSLGEKGHIGIYEVELADLEGGGRHTKYFIICHSGLPTPLVNEVNRRSYAIHLQNLSYEQRYSTNTLTQEESRITNDQEYGKGGRQEVYRAIALENGRRLCQMFADAVDLRLVGQEAMRYVPEPLPNQFCRLPTDGIDDPALIRQALSWYPRGAMIFPYTRIPKIEDGMGDRNWTEEGKEARPPIALQGYNLGKVLHTMQMGVRELEADPAKLSANKELVEKYYALIREFEVDLQLVPLTLHPTLETEYNTFRVARDGSILWYSNCTPIHEEVVSTFGGASGHGILVQKPFVLGYWAIESTALQTSDAPLSATSWYNNFLNAFPVLFPFDSDPRFCFNNINEFQRFFSVKNGGLTRTPISSNITPKHVQGNFRNMGVLEKNAKVRSDLMGTKLTKENENRKDVKPFFVFTSNDHFENPTFI